MNCALKFSRIGITPQNNLKQLIKSFSRASIEQTGNAVRNSTCSVYLMHKKHCENNEIRKIDPVNQWQPKSYEDPLKKDILSLYFGLPNIVHNQKTELDLYDNNKRSEVPGVKKTEIKCHRTIIITRKRKMKKHRLKRWRKKHANDIVKVRATKAAEIREKRMKDALDRVWQEENLERPPQELKKEEMKTLEKEWREAGLWTRALTEKELYEFTRGPPVFHLRPQIPEDSVWRNYKSQPKE